MSAETHNGGAPHSPNGDEPPPRHYPTEDANIRTTLMLVESLIHALIEKGIFTLDEAVEMLETVADLEEEMVVDPGKAPLSLVAPLAAAFRFELEQST